MTYEGSANYETHVVSLWIANDEGEYMFWLHVAEGLESADILADVLKGAFESNMPKLDGIWVDLLKAGFDEVDWLEVAKGIIEK